jgi:polyisoprenoid-binding protein YceI
MRYFLGFSAVLGLMLCGCTPTTVQQGGGGSVTTDGSEPAAVAADSADNMPAGGEATELAAGTSSAEPETTLAPTTGEPPAAVEPAAGTSVEASSATPVALADGVATLSAANTKIQFTGTHSPPKEPEPRVGVFGKFQGEAKVDAAAKTLQSVTVEIDTASLSTPIEKLTNHLRTEDFFDVREYPTAKFESTEITADEEGQTTIKGNLTLHGQTKEISIPATVSVTEEGLTLKSDFHISRAEFGIGKPEGIDDKVALSIAIGEKTATP